MKPTAGRIGQPQLSVIGGQRNAMTGATVTFGGTLPKTFHFHSGHHFSGMKIADLESKKLVHINEAEGFICIYGKGSDTCTERADFALNRVILYGRNK